MMRREFRKTAFPLLFCGILIILLLLPAPAAAIVTFTTADCACTGYDLPPLDSSQSNAGSSSDTAWLNCWYERWTGSATYTTATFHIGESTSSESKQRLYAGFAKNALPPESLGGNPVKIHEYIPPGPDRYSHLYSVLQPTGQATYYRGERALWYKSTYDIELSVTRVSDTGSPGELLAMMNATEECAKKIVDARQSGGATAAVGTGTGGTGTSTGRTGNGTGGTGTGAGLPGNLPLLPLIIGGVAVAGIGYAVMRMNRSRAGPPVDGDVAIRQQLAQFRSGLDDIIRQKLEEGYYVSNPDIWQQAILDFPVLGTAMMEEVLRGAYGDRTAGGVPIEPHPLHCQECQEEGVKWIGGLVRQTFGPGTILEQLVVNPDSYNNHIANQITLPNGERFIVDIWQGLKDGGARVFREEDWINAWQTKIGGSDDIKNTIPVLRNNHEIDLDDDIRKYGVDKGIDYFRKHSKNPEIAKTIINSYLKKPWSVPEPGAMRTPDLTGLEGTGPSTGGRRW
jgi:hypothetical protein